MTRLATLSTAAATFGVLLYASPVWATPSVVKGPYLQEVGPTSAEIRVELDAPAPVAVEIGKPGEAPRRIADATAKAFHVIPVSGLEPLTRYEYTLKDVGSTDKGTFTTAPRDDSGAPFKFLLYGDNRSNDDVHRVVVRAMLGTPSDFLIHTGDFAYSGGDEREWQTFFDIEKPLLRDRAIFSSVGNHELNGDPGGAAYERYLGPVGGKLYGTFRWSNARFFLLNAFTSWDGGEEREWLTRELEKADQEPGLKWRFVVIHHGPFSSGRHGSNEKIDRAGIPELLSAHKVDLVISGHDHMYERGEALLSDRYDLRYVVSGGSGAPLYDEIHRIASTRKVEPAYHFVEISVTNDTVAVVARRPDGSLLDRCGFDHGPGWDCDGARTPPAASAASLAPTPAKSTASPGAAAPAPASTSACGCLAAGAPAKAPFAAAVALLGAIVARRRAGRRRAF